jgi:hypothetical protein
MLSRAAGLERIAVNLAWVPPGKESAVYHLHHREEEWALPGQDLLTVQGGDAWSRSTVEIVDCPRLGLRETFVGTRSVLSFPVSAALEPPR